VLRLYDWLLANDKTQPAPCATHGSKGGETRSGTLQIALTTQGQQRVELQNTAEYANAVAVFQKAMSYSHAPESTVHANGVPSIGQGVTVKATSRDEMLAHLLDPSLTIEETALLLSVDQKAVRRYSNAGELPYLATSGVQRRFRLSDVLALMDRLGDKIELNAAIMKASEAIRKFQTRSPKTEKFSRRYDDVNNEPNDRG